MNKDYYEELGIGRDATSSEIRRAYYVRSMKVHPDRPTGNKEKFQFLSHVYSVLSDPEKRKDYNRFGPESCDGTDEADPEAIFSRIIKEFSSSHFASLDIELALSNVAPAEGELVSKSEATDLSHYYEFHKGDMKKVIQCVVGGKRKDMKRYCEWITNQIEEGELAEFDVFVEFKSKQFAPKSAKTNKRCSGHLTAQSRKTRTKKSS